MHVKYFDANEVRVTAGSPYQRAQTSILTGFHEAEFHCCLRSKSVKLFVTGRCVNFRRSAEDEDGAVISTPKGKILTRQFVIVYTFCFVSLLAAKSAVWILFARSNRCSLVRVVGDYSDFIG